MQPVVGQLAQFESMRAGGYVAHWNESESREEAIGRLVRSAKAEPIEASSSLLDHTTDEGRAGALTSPLSRDVEGSEPAYAGFLGIRILIETAHSGRATLDASDEERLGGAIEAARPRPANSLQPPQEAMAEGFALP